MKRSFVFFVALLVGVVLPVAVARAVPGFGCSVVNPRDGAAFESLQLAVNASRSDDPPNTSPCPVGRRASAYAEPSANLFVNLHGRPRELEPGESLLWHAQVHNAGPDAVPSIEIRVRFSDNVRFLRFEWGEKDCAFVAPALVRCHFAFKNEPFGVGWLMYMGFHVKPRVGQPGPFVARIRIWSPDVADPRPWSNVDREVVLMAAPR